MPISLTMKSSPSRSSPKPSNGARQTWEADEKVSEAPEPVTDDGPESPRGFLMRRGGFSDSIKLFSRPTTEAANGPSSARAAVASAGAPGGGAGGVGACGSVSARDASSSTPEIAPLRLHRLGSALGQSTDGGKSTQLPLRGATAEAPPKGAGHSGPTAGRGDGGGAAALALGAAPLSGFRAGRFTPRGTAHGTPRGGTTHGGTALHGGTAPTEDAAAARAAAVDATASEEEPDDQAASAACGSLRAFVWSGPPLPLLEGGGASARAALGTGAEAEAGASQLLPRSFWDACTPVRDTASGGPVCWPAEAEAPEHLRFFLFPPSLVDKLRLDVGVGAAPDGFSFTFSFTAADGAVRWGCAVTGAADASHRGALTIVSVALVGDWPLLRPMLDACKQLFSLDAARRASARHLGSLLRPFAASLGASNAEVSFLLQHPLWLPTPLTPLLEGMPASLPTLCIEMLR